MRKPFLRRTAVLLSMSAAMASAGSFELAGDTLDIPVGQYRSICFSVDVAQQERTRIEGSLFILPDTLEVEVLLFHRDDFERWAASLPEADTLFYERRGSGPISIPVEGLGDMALVISNRGNYEGASVQVDMDLLFAGDGVPYNPLLTGSRIVLGMLAGGVAAALILGILVKESGRRRRRSSRLEG